MTDGARLTTVDTVREEGSWLFTIRDRYDRLDEVVLVPCADDDTVEAWINRCTHEAQRLDRGFGAAMRDGQLICPKHGSMFDACSGDCDNGEAAGTTLVDVDVSVDDGVVFLTDDDAAFSHEGGVEDGDDTGSSTPYSNPGDEDDDDMPSSTSHIGL